MATFTKELSVKFWMILGDCNPVCINNETDAYHKNKERMWHHIKMEDYRVKSSLPLNFKKFFKQNFLVLLILKTLCMNT